MNSILSTLLAWHEDNYVFAIARVLSTWGSAPRRAGAIMLIRNDTEVVGSVSGGCIESSVIEAAVSVMESGTPEILEFGVDNERAWSVGLSCGGRVRVLVEPWSDLVASGLVEALSAEAPFVFVSTLAQDSGSHAIIFADGSVFGSLTGDREEVIAAALEALKARESREQETTNQRLFLHVFPSRQRLVLIGGADITVRLVALARDLDFEIIVVDPRAVFTSVDRFNVPPDRVEKKWPQDVLPHLTLDEDTFVVLLTHDPKIDDPALHIVLNHPVAYIGALGGRRTQEKRNMRLQEAGFGEEQINRIHGPVGIDIGAASPVEIALSILAEIVGVKNERV